MINPQSDNSEPSTRMQPTRQRRAFSLRAHLIGLAIVVVAPAIAAGTWSLADAVEGHRADYRARLQDTVSRAALSAERELETQITTLGTLATLPSLDRPDASEALIQDASRVGAGADVQIAAFSPAGRLLGTTSKLPHVHLPPDVDELVAHVVQTGEIAVSNLLRQPDPGYGPVVVAAYPVRRAGALSAVLTSIIPADHFTRLVDRIHPGESRVTLIDGVGVVIARSVGNEESVGVQAPPEMRAAITSTAAQTGQFVVTPGLDGTRLLVASRPLSSAATWTVTAGAPYATYAHSWTGPFARLAGGSALTLILAAVAATIIAKRLVRPVEHLRTYAEAIVAPGPSPTPPGPSSVREFEDLARSLAEAGTALRHQAQAAREAATENRNVARRYQTLAEAGASIIWRAKPDGRVTESLGWSHLTGQTKAEAFGDGWLQALHPKDRPRAAWVWAEALREGRMLDVEYRVQSSQSRWRWVHVRGVPVRDEVNQIVEWIGSLEDINDRRIAEAALADREQRLRLAVQGARLGVWEHDLTADRATYMRPEVGPMASLPQSSVTDEWRKFIHPDDRRAVDSAIQALISGDSDYSAVDLRLQAPNGQWGWIAYFGAVVERDETTGNPTRIAGVMKDITERREAVAAREQSEERLRLAVEGGRLGIWEIDARTHISTRSERLVSLLGLAPEMTTSPHEALRDYVHQEDAQTFAVALDALFEGTAESFRIEFRFRHPSGWRWIESLGSIVARDKATGAPLRLAGTAQDITDRRESEEGRMVLAREVDHRAKNALAVVQAVLRLTKAEDPRKFAAAVEGRVAALARAQTALAQGHWNGVDLRALVAGEVAPFLDRGENPSRVSLDGPAIQIDPMAVQPLSTLLHEMTTNAARHGALSVPSGSVAISWSVGPDQGATFRWIESGGPIVDGPPARNGFGLGIMGRTARVQLGGAFDVEWLPEGVHIRLTITAKYVQAIPQATAA